MDNAQRYDIDRNYKIGFARGIAWDADWKWVPGGPFFHNEESRAANEAWLRGWRDGIAAQRAAATE